MDMKAVNGRVIEDYRKGGAIGVKGMHRERMLLLTTTGRSSGDKHTAPMMYFPSERGALVVASNNGSAEDPQWYRNLEADPTAHVELPDEEFDATAEVAFGAQRDALWARVTRDFPFFIEHQSGVEREIPVVELVRV